MSVYYNEFDPFAAHWLRNLITAGHIPTGDVDERSILDVRADDIRGYTACHFFAGIGGWPYALRLAGWPEDRPVWTGSCPCQPLSSAGKRRGHADERHLWPAFHSLIAECAPPVVFGEQVASKDGREWFAAVRSDLEALGYACGGADLCAAGVGAPHIRQRLWWVADTTEPGRSGRPQRAAGADGRAAEEPGRLRDADGLGGGLGETDESGSQRRGGCRNGSDKRASRAASLDDGLGHAESQREGAQRGIPDGPGVEPGRGFWSDLVWLPCSDGKARPTQPGLFPLVAGLSGRVAVVRPGEQAGTAVQETRYVSRVGALRCAGNAIVPALAAEFIRAARDVMP